MKLGRLNHIGVATPSIADSIAFYRNVMGATRIHAPFDLPDQGVKVCFVDTPAHSTGSGLSECGGTQIELIEPLPGNTSIASFLEKNPAGGQHHMCTKSPTFTPPRPSSRRWASACWANRGSARMVR